MDDRAIAELESADNKVIFGWTLLVIGVVIGIFLFLTIGGYEWATLNLDYHLFEKNMPFFTLIIIAFIFIGVFLIYLGTSERLQIAERRYGFVPEKKIIVDNRERYIEVARVERRRHPKPHPKKHFEKHKPPIKHKKRR